MKYTGQFSNINNKNYRLEIITNGNSTSTSTLTLGETPCVIEWTGEEDNIFKPIKYSSATIQYVSNGLEFDLFSSKPIDNVVRLYDSSSNIIWQGYVTPNVYDNEFDFCYTTNEIECVDGLAVLEYINYSTIGGGAKKVVNVYDIIKHCLSKTNLTYNNLYISNNVIIDNTQWSYNGITFLVPDKSYLNICYISETNFWDEDDEPMKCSEVLEEICKYYNLTMYAEGQDIYMIDYCAIKNGINTYYKYNLNNNTCSLVSLSNTFNIGNSTNLIEETNISIGNTFNKVSVESDFYPIEKMIPDLFDEDVITQNGDLYYNWIDDKEGYMFYMFLNNPNYRSYYYNKDTYSRTYPSTITYDTIHNTIGATLVKHSFETYGDPGLVSTVNWTDYLLVHLHQEGNANPTRLKIFESNITDLDENILANHNNYLVINGTAVYYDIQEYTAKVEHSRDGDKYADSDVVIPCKLCYGGNKWYSLSASTTDIWGNTVYTPGWVDYETTFDLQFYSNSNRENYIGKDFQVRNNIMWYDGLDSTNGHKISLNGIGMTNIANLTFTMYAPKSPNSDYRLDYIFIKDFSIKVESSKNTFIYMNGTITDYTYADELTNPNTSGETNLIYENEIDEDYIEEFEEITNKITTYAKNKISKSTVAFTITDKSSLFYATTVNVQSLGGKIMKEEEYTINRLTEQYSTPSLILDVGLNTNIPMYSLLNNTIIDSSKQFIINSKLIDLDKNITSYKLIEKK